jgi:hypothetical protein
MWLEQNQEADLKSAIQSFPYKDRCAKPEYGMGDCDNLSVAFLRHAENYGLKGILLAVDNPHKEPTAGWDKGHWKDSGHVVSHYIAYFPEMKTGVDFTARQFWHDAPVPMIMPLSQIKSSWDELPFGMKDSREFEDFYDM